MSSTDDLRRLMESERRLRAQTQTTTRPASTTWPEGVIARYLTVGGATVDLTDQHPADEEPFTTTSCHGCQWRTLHTWDRGAGRINQTYAQEIALQDAKASAQAHASECRAMPNPGGTK